MSKVELLAGLAESLELTDPVAGSGSHTLDLAAKEIGKTVLRTHLKALLTQLVEVDGQIGHTHRAITSFCNDLAAHNVFN